MLLHLHRHAADADGSSDRGSVCNHILKFLKVTCVSSPLILVAFQMTFRNMDDVPICHRTDAGCPGGSGQRIHINIVQCETVIEALCHTGHAVGNPDFFHLPAVIKSLALNIDQLIACKLHRFQVPAFIEGIAIDVAQFLTQGDAL